LWGNNSALGGAELKWLLAEVNPISRYSFWTSKIIMLRAQYPGLTLAPGASHLPLTVIGLFLQKDALNSLGRWAFSRSAVRDQGSTIAQYPGLKLAKALHIYPSHWPVLAKGRTQLPGEHTRVAVRDQRYWRLMMNDADARRQTPGLTTPMSAVHLYWCLGVGSDVTRSAVQFIQYNLSGKLDNGYVKILPPNRIGMLQRKYSTHLPYKIF
jgi:hypothetical protein